MTVPTKLGLFGAVLALSFGLALGLGAIVGPIDVGARHSSTHRVVTHADGN